MEFLRPRSADRDGDRLSDAVETRTGVFVGPNNTGSDPDNPDSDGDGIRDGDEVLGTQAGLNLPSMGLSPVHKDILIEYDWFDDATACSQQHSHKPTVAMIDRVAQMFANAPVSNPDGRSGIHLIQDVGQLGGGNFIPDADGILIGSVFSAEFQNYRSAHMASNRFGYFHSLLSKLAPSRPVEGAISWVLGRDRARAEMRSPRAAVPINQGRAPAGRPAARWAGR